MDKPTEGKSLQPNAGTIVAFNKLDAPKQEEEMFSFEEHVGAPQHEVQQQHKPRCFAGIEEKDYLEDEEMAESFLNHTPLQAMGNPITIINIQQHQFEDLPLNDLRRQNPQKFPVKDIEGWPLICYRDNIDDPMGLWRITLPSSLVLPVIIWYHHVLGHCVINWLCELISAQFKAPALRRQCEIYQCGDCQRNKVFGVAYGLLPPWQAGLMPWSKNAVDLIGPWQLNIGGVEVEFNALTCIDM
eukprot:1911842-Ditylum_brightwellii.AAC.1